VLQKCKLLLGLGKDQSYDFNAQVFSITENFLRYSAMSFLHERENCITIKDLFEDLTDE